MLTLKVMCKIPDHQTHAQRIGELLIHVESQIKWKFISRYNYRL